MLRFTIRDLLWLLAVIIALVAWRIDRTSLAWDSRVANAKQQLVEGKLNDLGWRLKTMPSGREFLVEPIYRPSPSN